MKEIYVISLPTSYNYMKRSETLYDLCHKRSFTSTMYVQIKLLSKYEHVRVLKGE